MHLNWVSCTRWKCNAAGANLVAINCLGIVSKVIDINRGFGEGLWRFLREIMPNPACDRAMLVTTESIGQVSRDSFDAAPNSSTWRR